MKIISMLLILINLILIKCNSDCGKLQNLNDISKWNVGIYIAEPKHFNLICMGTIIESNIIITAAHCFCDNFSGKLRPENFYIKRSKNLPKSIPFENAEYKKLNAIDKKNIKIHENYQGLFAGMADNIALIKLSQDLGDIQPICWRIENNYILDNSIGKTITIEKDAIKLINANILDFDLCYALASKGFRIFLKGKLCAESTEIKEIAEDGGAGLILQNADNQLWYIRGILCSHESKSPDGTSSNENGVVAFINLILYMNWISNNIT